MSLASAFHLIASKTVLHLIICVYSFLSCFQIIIFKHFLVLTYLGYLLFGISNSKYVNTCAVSYVNTCAVIFSLIFSHTLFDVRLLTWLFYRSVMGWIRLVGGKILSPSRNFPLSPSRHFQLLSPLRHFPLSASQHLISVPGFLSYLSI